MQKQKNKIKTYKFVRINYNTNFVKKNFEKHAMQFYKKDKRNISLTILCRPRCISGVYWPFCIPFKTGVCGLLSTVAGVNCCQDVPGVEECVIVEDCEVNGGGECTGVDGFDP